MNKTLIIIALCILVVFLAFESEAQDSSRYIVLGLQPLNIKWIDEQPYVQSNQMLWTSEASWTELDHSYYLLYRVVDCQELTVTEIYNHNRDTFAWTFLEARGLDNQPHPNAGYYWIELIPFEWNNEVN